jgi:FrmR/RcnR family transcriptional regulator, repressor of frmRAB operon
LRLALLPRGRHTHTQYEVNAMSGSGEEKAKLVKRLGRIRGQMEAIRRALERDATSSAVLQQATACRGAMAGFIAEVPEEHSRERVVQANDKISASKAAEKPIGIIHSYLT